MAGETFRKPEEEQVVETPKIQAIPVRTEVQEEVSRGMTRQEASVQVVRTVQSIFDDGITKGENFEMKGAWRNSLLSKMNKIPNLFENCQVQYAYNQRQDIYSIKTTLDNRPRIITVRVGENFTELSLADKQGNVLEVARQEDGKGITFRTSG